MRGPTKLQLTSTSPRRDSGPRDLQGKDLLAESTSFAWGAGKTKLQPDHVKKNTLAKRKQENDRSNFSQESLNFDPKCLKRMERARGEEISKNHRFATSNPKKNQLLRKGIGRPVSTNGIVQT